MLRQYLADSHIEYDHLAYHDVIAYWQRGCLCGVYLSYLFDKNSIFKADFESEESLSGITRYKKMN